MEDTYALLNIIQNKIFLIVELDYDLKSISLLYRDKDKLVCSHFESIQDFLTEWQIVKISHDYFAREMYKNNFKIESTLLELERKAIKYVRQ